MSEDSKTDRDDDSGTSVRALSPRGDLGGGLFSVYKRGQGYWTRLITALVAAAILLVIANWLYQQIHIRTQISRQIALGIAAGAFIVAAFFSWRLMNSPRGAEFLITTDAEMKKVNWSSRKEVFGSTRVVIIFLFFVAIFLFTSDIFFAWFFHLIGVLKHSPF